MTDTVSLYVSVEVTLQTNGDRRLGSMRCAAVQNRGPYEGYELCTHPLNVCSKNVSSTQCRGTE